MTKRVLVRRVKPELQRYVREILWISAEQQTTQLLAPEIAPTTILWLSGATFSGSAAFPVAAVSGVHDRARIVQHAPGTSAIVVRFTELGLAGMLQQHGEMLFNESTGLNHFIEPRKIQELRGRLMRSNDATEQLQHLEAFLAEQLERAGPPNREIEAAARFITLSHGQMSISAVARRVDMSQSSLERHFRCILGVTPKLLSRLARLNYACKLWDQGNTLTRISSESGYSDQSHMIRDFKVLTGFAPRAYFGFNSARNLPIVHDS